MIFNKKDVSFALIAAVKAGEAIMRIYENEDFNVEMKSDNSPLTKADKEAHNIIVSELEKTNLPILSEESEDKDYNKRKDWKIFWLVDPLDGTKEFIKRNGEFTVNIALIENGFSNVGIIVVPVTQELYFGVRGKAAYKIQLKDYKDTDNLLDRIYSNKPISVSNEIKNKLTIVGSRSHMSEETEKWMSQFKDKYYTEIVSKGSSLKICLVAEGKAHLYPRFAPTMEWDTAAGHAIAIAAGAEIIDWETKQELRYNKENLLNPWFLVKPEGIEF